MSGLANLKSLKKVHRNILQALGKTGGFIVCTVSPAGAVYTIEPGGKEVNAQAVVQLITRGILRERKDGMFGVSQTYSF